VGGRGSIWGGLVTAFLVIPLFESLKSLMEVRLIIYGLLLILVMIFYPAGIVGLLRGVGQWIKQRRKGV
jgi:branched-chain amino acid transport system permease protein